MFNINSGYIGAKRSVRSQQAINSFEVPISMINKTLIKCFLDKYEDNFSKDDLTFLRKVSVEKWKFVAKRITTASSWHHTSSYFNKTRHYDLNSIAGILINIKDELDEKYKLYQWSQKEENYDIKYGVIKVQVWGGSRNRPKLKGYEEVAGMIVGDWLYYKCDHSTDGSIKKYKTSANKVEWLKEYDSYIDLTKNHEKYKNTMQVFNKLIEEIGI